MKIHLVPVIYFIVAANFREEIAMRGLVLLGERQDINGKG